MAARQQRIHRDLRAGTLLFFAAAFVNVNPLAAGVEGALAMPLAIWMPCIMLLLLLLANMDMDMAEEENWIKEMENILLQVYNHLFFISGSPLDTVSSIRLLD